MQRRTLAKGFLTAAAAAFGSHAIAKEAIPNFKWDEETEVLIAGFGGAGAAAAIEAHDAGAKVLILEKLEAGGGNTSVSAGGIMIPKDKEEAYEYLTKTFEYAGSEMDQELLRTFVDQIVQQREFLLGMAEGSRMGRYGGAGFPTLPCRHDRQVYLHVEGTLRGSRPLCDVPQRRRESAQDPRPLQHAGRSSHR